MTLRDKTAVVGVGSTPYYKRGGSLPQTQMEMACKATLAALDDAGLGVDDLDGFALYSTFADPGDMAELLGVPEVRFAAAVTSGGGGSAGSLGLAAAAVVAGLAKACVCLISLQQSDIRFGGTSATPAGGPGGRLVPPDMAFTVPAGLVAPGHYFSLIAQRHMHLYGTRREHFAEVCISQRENAIRRPTALFREPLTLEDYFGARMISDPFCLFDYTMECDGAVAVIVTSTERGKDLRHAPVLISGSAIGGSGAQGSLAGTYQGPDETFASAGARTVARNAFEMAGIGPDEVDVALLYDHFSAMVLFQLEDFGFCPIGESGPFVADGNIRWPGGTLPVNTHGGHLSEAYMIGMTHVREAVEQLRGQAINQVQNAEVALVSGAPSHIPQSVTVLRKP